MVKVLIPSGALGLNYDKKALKKGLKAKPDIIAVDGGSTDSGPAYLGKGVSKYSRAATKVEWKGLMKARHVAKIPLLIGTAGTCGTDSSVDWFLKITKEIAHELNQVLKIVVVKCSQSQEKVSKAFLMGKIKPLRNAPDLSTQVISACTNIVALAGVEQIIDALNEDPDIIIAGRTTDTAIIAALPIMKGTSPGTAWHGAKIAECGALCTTNPLSGVIIVEFFENKFTVEPMANDAKATPDTVSAHMLYENANPFILYEPGGYLDTTSARYIAENERKVLVFNSKWIEDPDYKVKIEGAALTGYQNLIIAMLRDKRYVANVEKWASDLKSQCSRQVCKRLSIRKKDFSIELRLIGKNACFGSYEIQESKPHEIGVLAIVTAESPELTNEIAKMLNPFMLHHPLNSNEELPTFAFPFSPADVSRGPVYKFCLHHTWELENPLEIFTKEIVQIDHRC